ncbi:MAG: exopolyphosphatase [Thiotrichales bacterium]|nr:exopolyphosphatase [Thiotrichales bacterium]MCY4284349.1 exopolyphosphatase [Thiotrichales bacterium]
MNAVPRPSRWGEAPATVGDPPPVPEPLAAIDLGSNSFHLVIGKVVDGHLDIVDRLREPVRLAAGLDDRKRLGREAAENALACLRRFAQRLRGMPEHAVRAVGTNTLRSARNGEVFRREAERVLGHSIEVIAGREEARLIYLGVAHALAGRGEPRLVIDIGGGSTECIIGRGFTPTHRESLYMGCVSMSRRFFPDGRIDKHSMKRAVLASRVELEPIERRYRDAGWRSAVGASGTVRAIAAIARAAGWCEHGVDRGALRRIRRALVRAGHVDAIKLRELREDRRPVLPGGVAVLSAVLDALDIEYLDVSEMALREGLLFDLIGRIRHEDVRDATVERRIERYRIDAAQGARVVVTALALHRQVAASWEIEGEDAGQMLGWAARLHEAGLFVSHHQYHKHGAYLLANGDMSGFSRQAQSMLAALVRGHRRKFPVSVFEQLDPPEACRARRLCLLLRLAVVLNRSRADAFVPGVAALAKGESLSVAFPPGWLDAHPLTRADLEQEQAYLAPAGMGLTFA